MGKVITTRVNLLGLGLRLKRLGSGQYYKTTNCIHAQADKPSARR